MKKKIKQMNNNFEYQTEQFADIRILRYQVPGFEGLTLNQKLLIYFLSEAAHCGRDILWDQNCECNLLVRKCLENIYLSFKGERDNANFRDFEIYLKRIWFSNGIHHHYSMDKFIPRFSKVYFDELIKLSDWSEWNCDNLNDQITAIKEVLFDSSVLSKRVSLDAENDLLEGSANNYYQGVTQPEAEAFYKQKSEEAGDNRISFGLNSTLVKRDGKIKEDIWSVEGKYAEAIIEIVKWLEKALDYAENDKQRFVIEKLIAFYRTGDLQMFDDYSIAWVKDLDSRIDFVNGFIEVYGDSLGIKGSWESIVNFKDEEATKRTQIIGENAQWFEDHSPVDPQHKKETVKGVSAKVITVAMLGGDCHPATPIGINLPNADWIREEYGSKSVTIENITHAYHMSSLKSGMLEEFSGSQEEVKRAKEYGYVSGNLHTDLHECLGHGSGKMMPGVVSEDLKSYASTIEETRADLFALYFMLDDKTIELGLLPNKEAAYAEYDAYIRNGLVTQLVRVESGKDIEESHMRNRQLIAAWTFEKGKENKTIEKCVVGGKTYFSIKDYKRLKELFGQLLKEVQRIKSEGDYEAAMRLVEAYGVKIDTELHEEILERYKLLGLAPYAGFINPEYNLVRDGESIVDVEITYPNDFADQMIKYSNEYAYL
ncbi:dihydrofolate reductase [Puteibacter caeruleilacunae]|nr:dihydrofolate reductase [Puteibacter caeruleilacunae]